MFDKLGYIKNKNLVPGMMPMPGIITQAHDSHNRRITNLRQVLFLRGKKILKKNINTPKTNTQRLNMKTNQSNSASYIERTEYRELLNLYWER